MCTTTELLCGNAADGTDRIAPPRAGPAKGRLPLGTGDEPGTWVHDGTSEVPGSPGTTSESEGTPWLPVQIAPRSSLAAFPARFPISTPRRPGSGSTPWTAPSTSAARNGPAI